MAEYPRLLNLDEETEARLKSWLTTEIQEHLEERKDLMDDLERWQKDYWVKPSTTVRKFPFYGASNIIVPLTAISVEAIHSRMMTTLFGISPIVSVQMLPSLFPPATDGVFEKFVDFELGKANFYNAANDMMLEAEKFGTLIGKSGYEKIVRKAVRVVNGVEEEFSVITKQGATIDPVALARFYMPFNAQDPQEAPWCGELHTWTPYQIKLAEAGGLFKEGSYTNILQFAERSEAERQTGSGKAFTQNQEELENRKPIWTKRVDFYEVWCAFDIDGDEEEEELQIFFHYESNEILAVRYNWYNDLHRPYRISQYIPVEHRWPGIGVCKQNDQFQREVTTIHRQRLDNATIANMRMFKVHKLSGYGPNEPIFPGKMWFLDDMTHMESLQAGEVYQSSFANEQSALIYSQQRTGVNEVMLGMPQVGTPGTATGDLARIQEGNKKFDFSLGHLKRGLNLVVQDFVCNVAQFGTRNVEYIGSVPNGNLIMQVLSADLDLIRRGIMFDMTLSGAQRNKLTDRNNWKELYQMLSNYYMQTIQLVQFTGDKQLTMFMIQKALLAGVETMRQIGETFDARNLERIIPIELERMLADGSQQSNNGGSVGGNQTTGSQPGMDLITLLGQSIAG